MKSYSLKNSLRESIFREYLFYTICPWESRRAQPGLSVVLALVLLLGMGGVLGLLKQGNSCGHYHTAWSEKLQGGAAYHSLGFEDDDLGNSPGWWPLL